MSFKSDFDRPWSSKIPSVFQLQNVYARQCVGASVETIGILAEKAFAGNWFNNTYNLKLTKDQLMELLKLATTNQLFRLDGVLYEQVEGVAMGSPLGPLLANTFMCSTEEKLEERNELPSFYKRFVDDTFTIMPDLNKANVFLDELNSGRENLNFTFWK